MYSIAFVIPYFGKWPVWFPAFLKSCATNPDINWIFYTDCDINFPTPLNITFYQTTFDAVKSQISSVTGVNITSQKPIKFCDLKPTYGHVFKEQLTGYDFWGFCDIDIIWGDIRKFITNDLLEKYDLISSRLNTISGHFTLLRNNTYCNTLYKRDNVYRDLFVQENYKWFDEGHFVNIVSKEKKQGRLAVYWDKYLLNTEKGRDSHQEYYLDKWLFDNGKLWDLRNTKGHPIEYMYLHFINWKVMMKKCQINMGDNYFYISYNRIHTHPNTGFSLLLNNIKNKIWGFYVKEFIRIKKYRFYSLKKRVRNKIYRTLGLINR